MDFFEISPIFSIYFGVVAENVLFLLQMAAANGFAANDHTPIFEKFGVIHHNKHNDSLFEALIVSILT